VYNDLSNEYNIVMSEIKNLTVAYNPNDFFYYSANFSDGTKITNDSTDNTKCVTYIAAAGNIEIVGNIDCRTSTISGNTDLMNTCYNKELCINRDNANQLLQLQTNHDGATTRKDDVSMDYNRELLKSYNLAIGCLGVLTVFYFLYE
jgi:uncharacterized sporulation protein YeaH/YhbH (DUF444 family)